MSSWQQLESDIILENPWIKIHKDKVLLPSGKTGEYTYVENIPFVVIVCVSEKGWLMVQQFRYTIQKATLEFPAGSIDGEEEAIEAAKRELQQESGYVADKWTPLGTIHESLSTNKTLGKVFLAQGLSKTADNQMIVEGIERLTFMSKEEIDSMIIVGKITDSKTIAAYYLAQQKLSKHQPRER